MQVKSESLKCLITLGPPQRQTSSVSPEETEKQIRVLVQLSRQASRSSLGSKNFTQPEIMEEENQVPMAPLNEDPGVANVDADAVSQNENPGPMDVPADHPMDEMDHYSDNDDTDPPEDPPEDDLQESDNDDNDPREDALDHYHSDEDSMDHSFNEQVVDEVVYAPMEDFLDESQSSDTLDSIAPVIYEEEPHPPGEQLPNPPGEELPNPPGEEVPHPPEYCSNRRSSRKLKYK